MFVINNARFCYQSKQKVLSSNTFGRIQMENLFNDDLDPSSYDESDNESDNEIDNESDNDETNEQFVKL